MYCQRSIKMGGCISLIFGSNRSPQRPNYSSRGAYRRPAAPPPPPPPPRTRARQPYGGTGAGGGADRYDSRPLKSPSSLKKKMEHLMKCNKTFGCKTWEGREGTRCYRKNALRFHPDRHNNKSDEEKKYFLEKFRELGDCKDKHGTK